MESSVVFHLSISIGHGFALDENGNAVSGVGERSEGLRGRKLSQECRSCGPAVTRNPRPRFCGGFCRRESSDRALDRTVSDVCR